MTNFNPTTRQPAQFKLLLCQAEDGGEYLLTYSRERGFFEPITNRDAVPVVGAITGWRYQGEKQ